MDLVTLCPFVASKVIWQAHSGAFALTVIVKATFVLHPGTSQLAPQQDPIHDRDRFYDEDPHRSVRISSDVAPYKPRADVLLVGRAYAPGKRHVRNLVTRFVVGEIDKSIEVWCDRAFRLRDGQLLEGKRFVEMPLVWERASGGPETTNPVGKRFDGSADAYGTIPIANLQPLGPFVSKRSDTFVPTCYAPIAPMWPGRTQKLGRLSRSMLDGAWNAKPLASDLDPSFFQAAPPDQNLPEIRPNERIVLENMHPEHARLATSLPGLKPRAIADRATGEREEIRLVGDTLWVDTDRGVCCVVWRGRIGLRHALEAGRIAIWVDGMAMTTPQQAAPSITLVEDLAEMVTTMAPKTPQQASALPFVPGSSMLAQVTPQPGSELQQNKPTGTLVVSRDKPVSNPIPFLRPDAAASNMEQTAPLLPITSSESMQFGAPTVPDPPMFPASPYANQPTGWTAPVDVPEMAQPAEHDAANPIAVAPPAMIGPLAKMDMPAPDPCKRNEAATQDPEHLTPPSAGKNTFNPADFPLEQCAALTASIARTKPNKARLLEHQKLHEKQWEMIQEYWQETIKAETRRGKRSLLDRYDHAYVAQLEKERGPITVDEYARLLISADCGNQDEVLMTMTIPRGACLPIQRVWSNLLITDAGLAKSVRDTMDEQS